RLQSNRAFSAVVVGQELDVPGASFLSAPRSASASPRRARTSARSFQECQAVRDAPAVEGLLRAASAASIQRRALARFSRACAVWLSLWWLIARKSQSQATGVVKRDDSSSRRTAAS